MDPKVKLIRIKSMLKSKIDEKEKEYSTLNEDVIFVSMFSGSYFFHHMKCKDGEDSNGSSNHSSS